MSKKLEVLSRKIQGETVGRNKEDMLLESLPHMSLILEMLQVTVRGTKSAGAHFDIWVADYYNYKPGRQDNSVFDPPPSCRGKEAVSASSQRSFPLQMSALLPAVSTGN